MNFISIYIFYKTIFKDCDRVGKLKFYGKYFFPYSFLKNFLLSCKCTDANVFVMQRLQTFSHIKNIVNRYITFVNGFSVDQELS